MKHERMKELLSDLHDGALAESERGAVEDHVGACAECRAEAALYWRWDALVRAGRPRPSARETEALVRAVAARTAAPPELALLDSFLSAPVRAASAFGFAFAALIATLWIPAVSRFDAPTAALLVAPDDGRFYALLKSDDAAVAGMLGWEDR
jgi:anti-sigma factor RsiW